MTRLKYQLKISCMPDIMGGHCLCSDGSTEKATLYALPCHGRHKINLLVTGVVTIGTVLADVGGVGAKTINGVKVNYQLQSLVEPSV